MKIALLAKNKLGFIDGSSSKADWPADLHHQWDRCNASVLSWILNTVSPNLRAGIVFASSASLVWADLKERFDKIDGSRIYYLHQQISSHTQGTLSISDYFTKLRLFWDEYDTLVPFFACDCAVSRQNNAHISQQRLFQLLLGLNESYAAVRSQILLMQPLPTVNQAYSMLTRDESQRAMASTLVTVPEPTVLYSAVAAAVTSTPRPPRFAGECNHCHMKGHKREHCYRLNGFPADFKFTKKKHSANNVTAATSSEQASKSTQGPTLTNDQYQQLLQLLQREPSASVSGSVTGSVNMAGMASVSNTPRLGWILDTGATNHMTFDLNCLDSSVVSASADSCVHLPNGKTASITHHGSHTLFPNHTVSNVFHIPDFQYNLLSISQLTKQLNCCVSFYPTYCILQDLCSGKMMGTGKEHGGLYFLLPASTTTTASTSTISLPSPADLHPPTSSSSSSMTTVPVLPSSSTFVSSFLSKHSSSTVWHARLGHPSVLKLKKINELQSVFPKSQSLFSCPVCPLAKQSKLPFPDRLTKTSFAFELIHIDLWGAYRISTHSGHRYFLTIVDDYTRMTWLYLLKTKHDTPETLKQFIAMVHNQFSVSIKCIRSDNGTEFFNQVCTPLFSFLGIIHQSSCVDTPQQNGVAERKHKHLLEVARALKFQGNLPSKFWGECVKTACYLINRLPSSVLNWKTPYSMLYHTTPSIQHLRVFGCLCYATSPHITDKFAPRAIPAVFLGYAPTQKGYVLFSLVTKKFFVNRNVIFHEHIFPFHLKSQDQPLFPVTITDLGQLEDHDFLTLSSPPDQPSSPDTQPPPPPETSSSTTTSQSLLPIVTDQLQPPPFTLDEAFFPPLSSPPLRRSSRSTAPPVWLKDYQCSLPSSSSSSLAIKGQYPLTLSYTHLPAHTQSFVASITQIHEPQTYQEAMTNKCWQEAMQQEIQALKANGTWEVVSLPSGKRPIGCKWVYKVKYHSNGTIERYKARLVAKGYNQREGIDFQDTFSPVAKHVTVRIVIAIAAIYNWPLYQMDVHNAFLQGDLHEEVYMQLPEGFGNQGGNKVCRLLKSLYGLKQASRQWNLKLSEALIQHGYIQSKHDYSMFTKNIGSRQVIMLIYVDDLLITGNDSMLIDELKTMLHKNFRMKDLGTLKYFLGIEVSRSSAGIMLSQRKYALELVEDVGLIGTKPVATPLEQNLKLTTIEFDEALQLEKNDEVLADASVYQRLIGRLLYLTHTRPDISYSVQHLSQFMKNPKKSHYDAALRVVKYVKKNIGQGILLATGSSTRIVAYCDSDWASCPMTRKSLTGFCVKLGNSLISWKAKKQSTISRSSAEAEYRSMASTVAELKWIVGLISELGIKDCKPVELYCDSQAAIQIAANPVYHERTKHIEIDCHFTRDSIQEGLVATKHISTKEQIADIFTKALSAQQHGYLLSKLGVLDIYHPPT